MNASFDPKTRTPSNHQTLAREDHKEKELDSSQPKGRYVRITQEDLRKLEALQLNVEEKINEFTQDQFEKTRELEYYREAAKEGLEQFKKKFEQKTNQLYINFDELKHMEDYVNIVDAINEEIIKLQSNNFTDQPVTFVIENSEIIKPLAEFVAATHMDEIERFSKESMPDDSMMVKFGIGSGTVTVILAAVASYALTGGIRLGNCLVVGVIFTALGATFGKAAEEIDKEETQKNVEKIKKYFSENPLHNLEQAKKSFLTDD